SRSASCACPGGGPTTNVGSRRDSATSRTFARLRRERATDSPASRSCRPSPMTRRLSTSGSGENRRAVSASQRWLSAVVVSPGIARGNTYAGWGKRVRATTRPAHPRALASPTPALSSSPTTQIRTSRLTASSTGAILPDAGRAGRSGPGRTACRARRERRRPARGPSQERRAPRDLVRRARREPDETLAGAERVRDAAHGLRGHAGALERGVAHVVARAHLPRVHRTVHPYGGGAPVGRGEAHPRQPVGVAQHVDVRVVEVDARERARLAQVVGARDRLGARGQEAVVGRDARRGVELQRARVE